MKLVEIVGLHIEATSGSPLVLLRELDEPHRVLPIFVGGPEAASIAMALTGETSPRPLAHDVMAALVDSVDAHVDAVEVTDVQDGAFLAELTISSPVGDRRVDSRPSDAIALAVRLGAPLFVSDAVLDEVGTVLEEAPDEEAPDEEAIEDEVARFRRLLDELDPADIADAIADTDTGTGTDTDTDADEPGT